MRFAEATGVEPAGEGLWKGQFVEGWDILGNTNGGYMLAVASRAAGLAAGVRDPVTITGHFTRPGHPGPVEARTEVVRSGRRFSVVRTTLTQEDGVVLETLGTFIEPSTEDPDVLLSDAEPLDLPPPEQCHPITPATDAPFPPPFCGKIDQRADEPMLGMLRGEPLGVPVINGWVRLRDDETLDPHALIMFSDAFPPTTFNAGLPIGWTPTLELTVHVRFPRARGWILCDFRSRFISGGFIEEDGLLWDRDGRLVAQSRQIALVSTP